MSRANDMSLERWFEPFRRDILGHDQRFDTPYGKRRIVYADWTASGRLYGPIEKAMRFDVGPFVGNTHTETSVTGTSMTKAYHYARKCIRDHVNAAPDDILITACSGMTRVISKLQRILGLRIPERAPMASKLEAAERPVVFVTHMEHHSNHTSWLETIADVEWLPPDDNGLVDPGNLEAALEEYADRSLKIGAFTACSNVTGITTPYYDLSRLMHRHGGWCFVDFAASGPYVDINMHPEDPEARLDAVYFSPHKFLGGPGSAAVLIFTSALYENTVPDVPGGGTVKWTNPWGEHSYINDIEGREDGGTPAFLQTIRTALAIRLKEAMGTANILARERELLERALPALRRINGIRVLAEDDAERLGIISFCIDGMHYNLAVRLLNDRFGIQVRGGCSCAGTYGHYLLELTYANSQHMCELIERGDQSERPGWVRLSLHPTMSDADLGYLLESIAAVAEHGTEWGKDYIYDRCTNEFSHRTYLETIETDVQHWFDMPVGTV